MRLFLYRIILAPLGNKGYYRLGRRCHFPRWVLLENHQRLDAYRWPYGIVRTPIPIDEPPAC